MKRQVLAACLFSTLAVFACGCTAQSGEQSSSTLGVGASESAVSEPILYVGDVEPGLDREVLAAQATEMTTVEEAAEGMGIPLTALQDIS
ncbi:MAG: hypothetical protein RBS17_07800, partial [Coriobacteriia bacterium]|nr:hypothetical protein [Coriobacteriia bacterium]